MDNMHLLHSTVDKQANSKYNQFVVDNPYRSDALSHYIADLERKGEWPGIVFVRTRRHAALLAGSLSQELGRTVEAISSDVNGAYREILAEKMRQRDPSCPVVVATAVWTTGLNIPSLSWVMMAGAGRAPVGLKQASGRPTRLEDAKPDYTIYDVVDIGLSWTEEQAAERRQHYIAAGFSILDLRLRVEEEDNPDARDMADLLSHVQTGHVALPLAEIREEPRMRFVKWAIVCWVVFVLLLIMSPTLHEVVSVLFCHGNRD